MSKPLILRAAPQSAWDTIDETLYADAQSSAFDPKLRKQITKALAAVHHDNGLIAEAISDAIDWQADKLDKNWGNDSDDEDRVHIEDTIKAYERLQRKLTGKGEAKTK